MFKSKFCLSFLFILNIFYSYSADDSLYLDGLVNIRESNAGGSGLGLENEYSFDPSMLKQRFSDLTGPISIDLRDIVDEVKGYLYNKNKVKSYNVLFYGEPGRGKTTLARYVADQLGLKFYYVIVSSLLNKYQGYT